MTKNEAAIAFAQGKKVQAKLLIGKGWGDVTHWSHFDLFNEFRLTPEPVPRGDLTYEEAVECIKRHEPVQVYWRSSRRWYDSAANSQWEVGALVSDKPYRRKLAPGMTELGPEDIAPGTVLREIGSKLWKLVLATADDGVDVNDYHYLWCELRDSCEYKPYGVGEWRKCEKEAK